MIIYMRTQDDLSCIPKTGRIESIYSDKGWYGEGYKRAKIRSESGNSIGTYAIPTIPTSSRVPDSLQ